MILLSVLGEVFYVILIWVKTAWLGEQLEIQNNEKTMKHSDHWIATGWYGEH
jgi:hypothetical protein